MRIKKTSQTTPTQAQITDSYSTSTTDGYSCTYINSAIQKAYSTSEQVIGTWIDNKPIYEKTVAVPQFSSTATTINTGISNISEVINMNGSFSRTGYTHKYPIFNKYMDEWYIDSSDGTLKVATNNQYVEFSGYITVSYTKTTDSAVE